MRALILLILTSCILQGNTHSFKFGASSFQIETKHFNSAEKTKNELNNIASNIKKEKQTFEKLYLEAKTIFPTNKYSTEQKEFIVTKLKKMQANFESKDSKYKTSKEEFKNWLTQINQPITEKQKINQAIQKYYITSNNNGFFQNRFKNNQIYTYRIQNPHISNYNHSLSEIEIQQGITSKQTIHINGMPYAFQINDKPWSHELNARRVLTLEITIQNDKIKITPGKHHKALAEISISPTNKRLFVNN
jgi:hypothetical protein